MHDDRNRNISSTILCPRASRVHIVDINIFLSNKYIGRETLRLRKHECYMPTKAKKYLVKVIYFQQGHPGPLGQYWREVPPEVCFSIVPSYQSAELNQNTWDLELIK